MAETLTAGEALIALRATSDKLSADMAAASKLITGELAKVEKSSASIDLSKVFKDGLAAAAAFAGGVGVVATAATQLALSSVKTGDEINRMSQAFGISAEELSGLKMAAEDVDVSFGQLQVGLKTLANQISDAASNATGPAAETFKALGIAVTDATGALRPTGDVLADVADKMAGMQDGAGKTAIATQLLGRSGQDLIPVLNGGSEALARAAEEARGLGVAFSSETAAAAAALDDQLDKLGHQIGGVANEIGQALMPTVSAVVGEVSEWIEQNRTLLGQSIDQWATGVKVAIDTLLPPLAAAAKGFKELGESMFGSGLSSLGELEVEEAKLIARTNELKGAIDSITVVNQYNAEMVAHLKDEYANLSTQLAGVQNRIKSAKGETVAGAAAFKQLDGATTGAGKAAGNAANNLGKLPPPIIKTGDAAKKTADANEKLQQSIEQLKLDALSDDLDDATAALERNRSVVADESYLRALQDIQAAYESQVETIKRTTEEAVAAGADRTLAAEREALAVESAQRDMAQAVEKLDGVLVKNAGTWDDLGAELAKLPPELSVISPQFAALSVVTGDATLATFGLTEATKEVSPAAEAASGTISDLSKAIVGLIDGTTDAGDVMQAFAGGLVDNLGGAVSGALKSSSFGKDLTSSLSGVFGPALGEAVATAGMSAVVQVGAGIFMSGVKDALEGEAMGAAAKIGLVVGGPIGAAIGVGIVSAFGIGQQSMVEQIAAQLGEMFKASFKADAVVQAINDGLVEVGSFLGPGLETLMIRAPKDMGAQVTEAWKALGTDSAHEFSEGFYQDMKEKGKQLIHSSIADVLHVLFPQIAKDLEVGIQQSAVAAGSAIAAEMGLLGDKAIKFAQQWGIAFIGMAQKAGLSADEILTALHRIDTSLGTSQELVGALQRLQAVLIESGEDVDLLFQKINEQLKTITGKKVKVGNLDEVLAAVGGDATRALGVIENGMEMAGISIEKFTGQLSDVVLAISNDAGTAIREAGEDFRRFGNEADGTAGILREKVLSALDDVIATAEELGYSTESIDAFKTAVGLISPEMLRSSEFVNALREDFARMAVESHMSVQELVDSIDPPLPEATRNAILAVNDLGKAIGDLTGAPLKNLKEVTDRMKQFGSEMYREVKDAEGNVTRELTAFGQELIDEASTAISGMWSQMNEDGWVGLDEIGVMFDQLALLPVEALNDPAIQQATRDLLAKIGAMTGDAAIIAMANAETITQDMIDQGLAAYDEYKKEIEENPPEVPPPTTPDGQPTTDPTQDPTAAATGAPPPQPIPPETTASYQTLADTATEYAKAVLAGREAVEALATTTVEASARMLESLRPLIGEPDDGVGLAALNEMFERTIPDTLDDLTLKIAGAAGDWKGAFDYARGAVIMLHDELNKLPTEKTITITVNQVGGTDVESIDIPTSHTGELIPGMPGEETLRILEAGELVIPADTVAAMGRGAFDLPASMVARLSYPVGVPSMASVAGAGAAASTPALDSEWTALPVRKRDLIEGAVLEVARATETGRARIDGRRFRVSPTYGRRR